MHIYKESAGDGAAAPQGWQDSMTSWERELFEGLKNIILRDPQVVFTLTEAAQYLRISRTSLYRLMERGEFPVIHVMADAPRILRADLDAFLQRRRDQAGPGGVAAGASVPHQEQAA